MVAAGSSMAPLGATSTARLSFSQPFPPHKQQYQQPQYDYLQHRQPSQPPVSPLPPLPSRSVSVSAPHSTPFTTVPPASVRDRTRLSKRPSFGRLRHGSSAVAHSNVPTENWHSSAAPPASHPVLIPSVDVSAVALAASQSPTRTHLPSLSHDRQGSSGSERGHIRSGSHPESAGSSDSSGLGPSSAVKAVCAPAAGITPPFEVTHARQRATTASTSNTTQISASSPTSSTATTITTAKSSTGSRSGKTTTAAPQLKMTYAGIGGVYASGSIFSVTGASMPSAESQILFDHIHNQATKRMATLDYLRKTYEGRVYWFNTLRFDRLDLTRMPSFDTRRLGRRATNYLLLGLSIPSVVDLNATSVSELLRSFTALLAEFESFQQLHAESNSGGGSGGASSLSRAARLPHMFRRTTTGGGSGGKVRRTSSSTANEMDGFGGGGGGSALDRNSPYPPSSSGGLSATVSTSETAADGVGNSSLLALATSESGASLATTGTAGTANTMGAASSSSSNAAVPAMPAMPLVPPTIAAGARMAPLTRTTTTTSTSSSSVADTQTPGSTAFATYYDNNTDLLPGEEYSLLLTPSLPFDPDFFETFATLCEVLTDCYARILRLLPTPRECTPVVAELFSKADGRVRKLLVHGAVKEFEDHSRAGIKMEVANVGKVVLAGLL